MTRPRCAWVLPGAPADPEVWAIDEAPDDAPPPHLLVASPGEALEVSVEVTLEDPADVPWDLRLVALACGRRLELAHQRVPRGETGRLLVDLATLDAPPVGRWRLAVLGRAVDAFGPDYAWFESRPAELLCVFGAPTGPWSVLAALADPRAPGRRPPLALARIAASEAHGARTHQEVLSALAGQLWQTLDGPMPPRGLAFRYGADDWASPGWQAPWNLFGFLNELAASSGFGETLLACDGASALVCFLAGAVGVEARLRSANVERGFDPGGHLVFPGVRGVDGGYPHHTVVSYLDSDGVEYRVDPTLAPGPKDVGRVWTASAYEEAFGARTGGWTWTEAVPPMLTDDDNQPVPGPPTAEEQARRAALWTPSLRAVDDVARALVTTGEMRWMWKDLVPLDDGRRVALRITLAHPKRRRFLRVDAVESVAGASPPIPYRQRFAHADDVDWVALGAVGSVSAFSVGGSGAGRAYALESPPIEVVVRDLGRTPMPVGELAMGVDLGAVVSISSTPSTLSNAVGIATVGGDQGLLGALARAISPG